MTRRRKRNPVRGAAEFSLVFALLSFVLPGRGFGLAVVAAVVGFAVGYVLEVALNRGKRNA